MTSSQKSEGISQNQDLSVGQEEREFDDELGIEELSQTSRRHIESLERELEQSRRDLQRARTDLCAITQSRIWRYTNALRRAIDSVRRIRGKYLLHYQLPVLVPLFPPEAPGSDERSENFSYEIDLARVSLGYGWHAIKLLQFEPEDLERTTLYFDYGNGYSAENKISYSSFGASGLAVMNLQNAVCGLRLDFTSSKSPSVRIGIRPISKPEALYRYARLYLDRQREAGIPMGRALSNKVRALGGWRQLTFGRLLGYVNSYESIRRQSIGDQVIADYASWVSQYELPYLKSEYEHPRSKSCYLVLVLLAPLQEIGQYRKFDAVVEVVSGTERWRDVSAGYFQTNVNSVDNLLAILLDQFDDSNAYFVFCGSEVLLGPYLNAAIERSIDQAAKSPMMLYCDCDSISVDGERQSPWFMPEWSPEFQYSSGYIGQVAVLSRQYLAQLDMSDIETPLNHAISLLVLAGGKLLTKNNVLHIPEVHVHYNEKRSRSPQLSSQELAKYLPDYEVDSNGFVLPMLPVNLPLVSIIIPTKDQAALLKGCISSIQDRSSYKNYELIIIDNGTTEQDALGYLSELSCLSNVKIIRDPGPFNYSALNNKAVKESSGDVLVLLNNDVEVIGEDWLEQLVRYAIRPDIGCVGAKLLYPDGRIQHAGVVLGVKGVGAHGYRLHAGDSDGYQGRLRYPQEYTAVTAACLAVRRSVYDAVGGLNERNLAVAFNDVDFCLRVWESGYRNLWTPMAELYHYESISRGEDLTPENASRLAKEASYMMQRWGKVLPCDPAYNPNLSLTTSDFDLSTRYVGSAGSSRENTDVNPCRDPYYYSPNIARVNNVIRQDHCSERKAQEREEGLSVVILTLERYELISELLYSLVPAKAALGREHGVNLEVVVGDTGSTSAEVERLYNELSGEITLVRNLKYNFSSCNNLLFKSHTTFDTVLFLNNDIIFDDPVYSLLTMYRRLKEQEGIGAVGPYMIYPDGKLQHGGVDIYRSGEHCGLCYHPGHGMQFSALPLGSTKRYPAVTGACLMMDADVFEACDYFDESYEVEAQDVDLCLKASRYGLGSEVMYVGKIVHYENGTRKKGDFNQRDRSRFVRKWRLYQEIMLND